jgi:predicted transcriptional regulator
MLIQQELLTVLGLSQNEAKIYESLLGVGAIGISEVATRTAIHRRNVYDSMQRLLEKGLVFRIFRQDEYHFQAVNPEKLQEILQEHERRLTATMPSLTRQYGQIATEEAAYIYKGKEGYKNYLRDMIRVADTTYFFGAKALWYTPWVELFYLDEFSKALKENGKEYYTLYDPRVPLVKPEALQRVGGHAKVLPEHMQIPGVVDIFGNYVVTFTSVDVANFGEEGTIFVLENKELADTYRAWFNLTWELIG